MDSNWMDIPPKLLRSPKLVEAGRVWLAKNIPEVTEEEAEEFYRLHVSALARLGVEIDEEAMIRLLKAFHRKRAVLSDADIRTLSNRIGLK